MFWQDFYGCLVSRFVRFCYHCNHKASHKGVVARYNIHYYEGSSIDKHPLQDLDSAILQFLSEYFHQEVVDVMEITEVS